VPVRPVPAVEAVEWLLMECAYFRGDPCPPRIRVFRLIVR